MSDFVPGLEGVVAFETEIAEPDKEGGALRYRGVDIEDLVGSVSFGNVWGLLVDGAFDPGLPPAEPFPIPVHSGDIRVDVQSALAMLAPVWGLRPLLDIDEAQARDDLARAAVMALSYVAQSARGQGLPMVPQREIDKAETVVATGLGNVVDVFHALSPDFTATVQRRTGHRYGRERAGNNRDLIQVTDQVGPITYRSMTWRPAVSA